MKSMFYSAVLLILSLTTSSCLQEKESLALGILARDRIILTATSSELIVDQPIQEGSTVSTGDLLVQLDDQRQRAVVAQAAAEVESTAANLKKLVNGVRQEDIEEAKARVTGNEAALNKADLSLERAHTLLDQRVLGEAELDAAVADRAEKEATLRMSQEELKRLVNGTRPEELEQARAQLLAAQAQLKQQEAKLKELRVTATRDGWLDSLPWNIGERVFTGSPVAVLITSNTPHARVYIPEPYRVHVKEGDQLAVKVDGFEKAWTGTVRWIAKDATFTPYYALNAEERSRLMFLAEIELPDTATDLPNGLPVQVELP